MTLLHTVQQASKQLTPADITLIGGVLATGLHYLLTHFVNVNKIVNVLISFVLPSITVCTAYIATNHPNLITRYPWVFVIAQAVYQGIEWIRRNAVKSLAPSVSPDTSF